MSEIIKSIELLRGDTIDMKVCRGINISSAGMNQLLHNMKADYKLDLSIFLMNELCLVNGSHKDIEYFKDLLSDDYMLISESINEVLEKIQ